jgi:hypothetical protein
MVVDLTAAKNWPVETAINNQKLNQRLAGVEGTSSGVIGLSARFTRDKTSETAL